MTSKVLKLSEEQRSMIAGAVMQGRVNADHSLCCRHGARAARVSIVGEEFESALHNFVYERLGCGQFNDSDFDAEVEQRYLDAISELEELSLAGLDS